MKTKHIICISAILVIIVSMACLIIINTAKWHTAAISDIKEYQDYGSYKYTFDKHSVVVIYPDDHDELLLIKNSLYYVREYGKINKVAGFEIGDIIKFQKFGEEIIDFQVITKHVESIK